MKPLLIACLTILICQKAISQGCVAIRSAGGSTCSLDPMYHDENAKKSDSWTLGMNNRYFRSFRHFVGKEEQKQRLELGTEVINYQYTADITLTRVFNSRWSAAIDLPYLSNARSSLYEHKSVGRYSTHSSGLGDIRIAAYAWLFNPLHKSKANIQAGLGIKLPTGDYRYQDYFQLTDSTKVLGPVDQSVQLGDGGTGFTVEFNGYYNISRRISLYGNVYYLVNSREQNGVSTARGSAVSAASIKNGSDVMSVPDQYMIRAGVNASPVKNMVLSVGVRHECLPSEDLVGGNRGFRRPGYVLSVDPGLNFKLGKVSIYAYVPVAVVRNRTQSEADRVTTKLTGKYTKGDAAFADYAINIGASFRL